MFLLRENAYQIFQEYLEFRLQIQFFKEYCQTYKRWWFNNKEEYESQLRQFEKGYDKLMLLHGEIVDHNVEKFITRVKTTLVLPKFNRESIDDLWRYANRLEMECDEELFSSFFYKRSFMYAANNFSEDLIDSVSVSIDTKQYDAAIVEAFKTFEEKITSKLNVTPIMYSGVDLANFAFGSKTGKVQLGTNEAEQLGLRNLYAGAYSLFRNPSAHRFVGNNEVTTNTIVALLSLILKIVEDNSETRQ